MGRLSDGVCTDDVRTSWGVSFVRVLSITLDVVAEGDLSAVGMFAVATLERPVEVSFFTGTHLQKRISVHSF